MRYVPSDESPSSDRQTTSRASTGEINFVVVRR